MFLLVSCSMTKIFYNYADLLVVNWFESYIELSETQRSDLYVKVDKFFAWHRKSELPKTVLFLEKLKVRYENGIDKQDINWIRSESKILLKRVLRYAEADIVSFLLTIDDYQVLEAKEKLSKKEDDWLIEQSKMSFEELREHTLERSYDFFDEWLGSLKPDQKQIIATWVQPDPNWVAVRLRNRDKFQSDLIDLLKSKERLKTNIHSWINDPETHWTDEYKSVIEGKRQEWGMVTLVLDSNTTPRQRDHAIEKLSQYIEDFKELTNVNIED
jgi:hypothetical protein